MCQNVEAACERITAYAKEKLNLVLNDICKKLLHECLPIVKDQLPPEVAEKAEKEGIFEDMIDDLREEIAKVCDDAMTKKESFVQTVLCDCVTQITNDIIETYNSQEKPSVQ